MHRLLSPVRRSRGRAKAVFAAGLGNALEWYDIILFGFMATSITAVFYPGDGLSAQLMTWATFAITFVARPSARSSSAATPISTAASRLCR